MARLLAYTSPARGHLYPLTPILDQLAGRGHEISVRTLASEVPMIQSRGMHAAPISHAVEAIELDDFEASNSRAAIGKAVATFAARAEHDEADLRGAINEVQPDALLIDINCWGAAAVAEAWGGPWAMFSPYPLPLRSVDAPPFGPGLAPAKGWLGRLRDRIVEPIVIGTIEKQFLPPVNSRREENGLPAIDSFDETFRRPHLLLYMTAEPFEYPRTDWPANIEMVGPCAWEPQSSVPNWLDELRKPLVLVTTSSEFQDDGKLVATALAALADQPYDVVATVPSGDPAEFDVPENARVEKFVPHGPLLERAVCAITHGGMGATQKALARGVPVCAVPFGRDQLEVARRVEVSGAGTRLPVRRLNAKRLREKVQQAVGCSEGASRVAAAYAATGGPAAAADAVERMLSRSA